MSTTPSFVQFQLSHPSFNFPNKKSPNLVLSLAFRGFPAFSSFFQFVLYILSSYNGAAYLLKPLSINKKRLHFKQAVKTTKNADCQKQSAFKSLIKFYFSISNTHKALRVLESKISPSSTISLTCCGVNFTTSINSSSSVCWSCFSKPRAAYR